MKYVLSDDVLSRLQGKVRVTEDAEADEGIMPVELFGRLIDEAESQVEYDMSERYASPFSGINADGTMYAYRSLPDSPTRTTIRRMVVILSCIYVLETDFGQGTIVEGAKYREQLQKQYDRMVDRQLEKRKDLMGGSMQWRYPPLPGLALAPHNEVADDGYAGTILVSSQGDGDYPQKQINNPSQTLFGGKIDP